MKNKELRLTQHKRLMSLYFICPPDFVLYGTHPALFILKNCNLLNIYAKISLGFLKIRRIIEKCWASLMLEPLGAN